MYSLTYPFYAASGGEYNPKGFIEVVDSHAENMADQCEFP